jgi:hypothetical protein
MVIIASNTEPSIGPREVSGLCRKAAFVNLYFWYLVDF